GSSYACRGVLAPCLVSVRTRSRFRTEQSSVWTTVVVPTPTCSPTIRLTSCRRRSGTPSSGMHQFRSSTRKIARSGAGIGASTSHAAWDVDAGHGLHATYTGSSLCTALGRDSDVVARLYRTVTFVTSGS